MEIILLLLNSVMQFICPTVLFLINLFISYITFNCFITEFLFSPVLKSGYSVHCWNCMTMVKSIIGFFLKRSPKFVVYKSHVCKPFQIYFGNLKNMYWNRFIELLIRICLMVSVYNMYVDPFKYIWKFLRAVPFEKLWAGMSYTLKKFHVGVVWKFLRFWRGVVWKILRFCGWVVFSYFL